MTTSNTAQKSCKRPGRPQAGHQSLPESQSNNTDTWETKVKVQMFLHLSPAPALCFSFQQWSCLMPWIRGYFDCSTTSKRTPISTQLLDPTVALTGLVSLCILCCISRSSRSFYLSPSWFYVVLGTSKSYQYLLNLVNLGKGQALAKGTEGLISVCLFIFFIDVFYP